MALALPAVIVECLRNSLAFTLRLDQFAGCQASDTAASGATSGRASSLVYSGSIITTVFPDHLNVIS